MYRLIPLLLFIALQTQAQEPAGDTTKKYLLLKEPYRSSLSVMKVREHNGKLILVPVKPTSLTIGGNYTFAAAMRKKNATPVLQNKYTQGPDTTDSFSYGPPITTTPYDNSIFRTGYMISHSLSVQANINGENHLPIWSFALKAGTSNESTVIQDNRNSTHNLSLSIDKNWKRVSIAGGYSYFHSGFSNDNSYGFLNQVYQNSLITPINIYSTAHTLLNDNGHFADRTQHTGNLSLKKKQGQLSYGVLSTLDVVNSNSHQLLRRQDDKHYSTNAYTSYTIKLDNYHYSIVPRLNYIYNNEDVNISYPAALYHYHRTTNEAALTVNTAYSGRNIDVRLNAGNKFYQSSTGASPRFFLPEISGLLYFWNLIDHVFDVRLATTYTIYYNEPAIDHSLSSYMYTQKTPQDALNFFPTTEVQSFKNLNLMQQREFTYKLLLDLRGKASLNADVSIRNTKDNVFPVYENNQLVLKNMADTRYKGFELQLCLDRLPEPTKYFSVKNSISFYVYSNTVIRVRDGYDSLPLSGFTTVHKALIKGQPLGVFVGNDRPSIIGNPTPDFTLKFAHLLNWKNIFFNIDWEYRKGGDIWNGTQAVLDYYGRSAASVAERHTIGFIPGQYGYTGVTASYIQKGDNIRIHNLSLAYDIKLQKYLQKIRLTVYTENLILWSAYKGGDPNQLLYDQPGTSGLDFFNLPSTKTFGLNLSLQF